jgi:hypothetical protein
MMKAQVQAISLVIITGIVMSLAGAAYLWGKPLMEKRSSITDISTAESFMAQLDKEIVGITRNKGEKSVNIPNVPGASFIVDEAQNAIIFKFLTNQPMIAIGDKAMPIPIETTHIEKNGTYGESPRTITLQGEAYGTEYLLTLKMTYRTLFTASAPKKAYQISVRSASKTGNSRISVAYGGTATEAITDEDGRVELLKTYIDVGVS